MGELDRIVPVRVPRTLIGFHASEKVGAVAKEFEAKKVLIVTDAGVMEAGLVEGVKASLQEEGFDFEIFDRCPHIPHLGAIHQCSRLIKNEGFDLLIGVGGGSVMDMVKLATIVAAHDGDVSILSELGKIKSGGLPKILIPTTSGTGSEWSDVAVFTDKTTKRIIPIHDDCLWADTAIIDPLLTLNLPHH